MNKGIRYRDSALINTAYQKLVLPDVASRMCNMVVMIVNSFIAARFIGTQAMSAISLVAPISLFSTCLYDLFGSGLSQIIIKYKSQSQTDKAARAFGAITANTFFWYVIFSITTGIFAKDILKIFTQDEALIADGMQYLIPMLVCEPFCVTGLCLEKGFKSDGRNGFFGIRAIITNVLNVVFSLITVLVFDGGIMGLAMSGYAAGFLGYCWSFSHCFSSKCTIRPDFTVLKDMPEVREYVDDEIRIGSVFALDDGCLAVASSLINKAYIKSGGAESLAAIGIANSVLALIKSVNGAIQASFHNLSNLFYFDRDFSGCVRSLKTAVTLEAVFSAFAWLILNIFSQQIGWIYKVDNSITMAALKSCFCFLTVAVIADCYSDLYRTFMMSTNHVGSAAGYVFVSNAMLAVCALIGLTGIDFNTLLCIQMAGRVLVAISESILCRRYTKELSEETGAEIQTYSYILEEDICAKISRKVKDLCESVGMPFKVANKAALLVEECSRLILYFNQDNTEKILIDFRISANEKDCVITIIDTGNIFDPIRRLTETNLPDEYNYAIKLISGFSPEANYARVANLNVSHLIINLDSFDQQNR